MDKDRIQELEREGDEEFEQSIKRFSDWIIDTACDDEDMKEIFTEKELTTDLKDHAITETNNMTEITPDKTIALQNRTSGDDDMSFFKRGGMSNYTKLKIPIEQKRLRPEETGKDDFALLNLSPGITIECDPMELIYCVVQNERRKLKESYQRVFSPDTAIPEYLQMQRHTTDKMYQEWKHAQKSLSMCNQLQQTGSVASSCGASSDPLSPERAKSEPIVRKKKSLRRYLMNKIFKRGKPKTNSDIKELHLDFTSFDGESDFEDDVDEIESITPVTSYECSDWYFDDLKDLKDAIRPTIEPYFTDFPILQHVFQDSPMAAHKQHLQLDISTEDQVVSPKEKSKNPFRRMHRWLCKKLFCCCKEDKQN